jgi:hypothetical protein
MQNQERERERERESERERERVRERQYKNGEFIKFYPQEIMSVNQPKYI